MISLLLDSTKLNWSISWSVCSFAYFLFNEPLTQKLEMFLVLREKDETQMFETTDITKKIYSPIFSWLLHFFVKGQRWECHNIRYHQIYFTK